MNIQDLKKPFPHGLISWRVGPMTKDKSKGVPLAYIDARDVMERLDEVCGPENWQATHPHANGKTSCRIGIKIGDEWVWKENGAGDSAMDAEKGAFSDSFKRAAVLWGIGRYLYDVPNVWLELDEQKKLKNPNDKRLIKALEDAEKGIRGIDEPEPTPDQKAAAMQWVAKAQTDMQGLNTVHDLRDWMTKHAQVVERLKNYPEVEKSFNDAYRKRLTFVSQAPLQEAAE